MFRKDFARCVPFVGFGVYAFDAIEAFDESPLKSVKTLTNGMLWLAIDLTPFWLIQWLPGARVGVLGTIYTAKNCHTASKSNHLFPTMKESCVNSFFRCKRLFKKPPNDLIDAGNIKFDAIFNILFLFIFFHYVIRFDRKE